MQTLRPCLQNGEREVRCPVDPGCMQLNSTLPEVERPSTPEHCR